MSCADSPTGEHKFSMDAELKLVTCEYCGDLQNKRKRNQKYIEQPHPMQPIHWKIDRAVFKENAIVSFLLEAGPFNLNQLHCMNFSKEDWAQFIQLTGGSVAYFSDLSYIPDELVEIATKKEKELKAGLRK